MSAFKATDRSARKEFSSLRPNSARVREHGLFFICFSSQAVTWIACQSQKPRLSVEKVFTSGDQTCLRSSLEKLAKHALEFRVLLYTLSDNLLRVA